MKTSEFIRMMESLGYEVDIYNNRIFIIMGDVVITVYVDEFGAMNTEWSSFNELEQDERETLLEVAYTYITTPLVEREEPKKYYLRLPKDFIGADLYSERNYLNFNKLSNKYLFAHSSENSTFQTQFTQDEIDKLDTTHLIKEEVQ